MPVVYAVSGTIGTTRLSSDWSLSNQILHTRQARPIRRKSGPLVIASVFVPAPTTQHKQHTMCTSQTGVLTVRRVCRLHRRKNYHLCCEADVILTVKVKSKLYHLLVVNRNSFYAETETTALEKPKLWPKPKLRPKHLFLPKYIVSAERLFRPVY